MPTVPFSSADIPLDTLRRFRADDATTEIGDPPADSVGVFLIKKDKKVVQLFSRARPIKLTVKESAHAMTHPVESGSVITDHRIINPIEIDYSVMVDPLEFRATYDQIKQAFLSSSILSVQTKTGFYKNMMIAAIPHDESADTGDSIPIAISFVEVKLVGAKFGAIPSGTAKNENNADTTKAGDKQYQSGAKDLLVSAQTAFRNLF